VAPSLGAAPGYKRRKAHRKGGLFKAFDEFFAPRTEPFLALSGNQCVAIKA
jgi:hypothetical protein